MVGYMEKEKDVTIMPKVADTETYLLFKKEENSLYCIGNDEKDRYVMVSEKNLAHFQDILTFFDGNHSIQWINTYFKKNNITIDAYRIYTILSKNGLIVSPEPETVEHGEFKTLSVDVMEINAESFFRKITQYSFIPSWYYAMTFPLIIYGLFLFFGTYSDAIVSINTYKMGEYVSVGWLVSLLLAIPTLLLHECGHGITASKMGISARTLYFSLYCGFIPFFYLHIPHLYPLKRMKRIIIFLSGVYVNLWIFSLAIVISHHGSFTSLSDQLLWKLALVNLFIIGANLIPFLPTDGYFVLTNVLKTPNLRTRAFIEFKKILTGNPVSQGRLVMIYLSLSIFLIFLEGIFLMSWIYFISVELYTILLQGVAEMNYLAFFASIFALSMLTAILFTGIKRGKEKFRT